MVLHDFPGNHHFVSLTLGVENAQHGFHGVEYDDSVRPALENVVRYLFALAIDDRDFQPAYAVVGGREDEFVFIGGYLGDLLRGTALGPGGEQQEIAQIAAQGFLEINGEL